MNNNDNSFWDDNTVGDYAALFLKETLENALAYQEGKVMNPFTTSTQFKQKRQNNIGNNKDWEIVAYKVKGSIFEKRTKDKISRWFTNDDFYWSRKYGAGHITNETMEMTTDLEIYSVRRLSDNEVFSLGDKINENGYIETIHDFKIIGDTIEVNVELPFDISFSLLKKAKLLFTTHDGKDIYEGDRAWLVNKHWTLDFYDFVDMGQREVDLRHYPNLYVYFSTEEAAKEYILSNKPILSLNDLLSVWHIGDLRLKNKEAYSESQLFQNFKQLAEQKLNL